MYVQTSPVETQDPVYLSNRKALQSLQHERELLTAWCYWIASVNVVSLWFSVLGLGFGSLVMGFLLRRLQKTSQICLCMEKLLDVFEAQGIEIIPRIQTNPESLDLFVKFPTKQLFGIAIRSNGKSFIKYREDKGVLYSRYAKGGSKAWRGNHLQVLSDQEFWIRKTQRYLFGASSNDRRRPLIKVLVLTGDTQLDENPEHLYVTIGDQKVLSIRQRGTTYVMREEQLEGFIRGLLAEQARSAEHTAQQN